MDIRFVATDCDGCLTDNGVYYFAPDILVGRKFNVMDGHGFSILHNHGVQSAIVTSSKSGVIRDRADWVQTQYIFSKNKAHWLQTYMLYHDLEYANVAFMGNDVIDLGALALAGIAACPRDAHPEVRAYCETRRENEGRELYGFVTHNTGGNGAFREFVDYLIYHKFI